MRGQQSPGAVHLFTVAWTTDSILGLAPDPASAKAGQALASPRKWATLGSTDAAVWGECQGSGKNPYQTQIDLNEPAFRCSCPSRKFPCKHALGLFLLLANQAASFTEHSPPGWVTEWFSSRANRAERKAAKAESQGAQAEKPVDEAAQRRRAASRQSKVTAGFAELEVWLRDLVRHGLAALQSNPPSFWEQQAARLIDAQAPGAARMVRDIAGAAAHTRDWQSRLLERLAKLYLLVEGYKRIDTLPGETQADMRAAIGWTVSQNELLDGKGVHDTWLVAGQRTEEEDRLRVRRTWLLGETSGRSALVLQFAHGNQPMDATYMVGSAIEAELVYYPSAHPLRAMVKVHGPVNPKAASLIGHLEFDAAIAAFAGALARNPWLEQYPVALGSVIPLRRDGRWVLRDAAGSLAPVANRFKKAWELSAVSGGHPLSVFGEWDGERLLPLAALAEGRWVAFE